LVTNSSGCSRFTANVTIINTCREEAIAETRMHVYPNPTNNSFVLDMTIAGMVDGSAEIEIMDLMGQQVTFTNSDVKDGRITASLAFSNAAAAGVYMVRVHVQNETYTTQVILTR
jgi:5-hydroxyisourate hydrolase-like protein (transthyretin family)